MPWGKGTVVTGAKGYVFLSGNTARGEDHDPLQRRGGAIGDPAMQWRAVFANIKSDLEELGSSTIKEITGSIIASGKGAL